MSTLLKVIAMFVAGILFSACRTSIPPEEEKLPDDDNQQDEQFEEDLPDEIEERIDQELEIIDALEIDPYWNTELQEDLDSVFNIVLDVCKELEADTSISDAILDLMNAGVPNLSAEHMLEVAVFIVCPEFEEDYEEYLLSKD